ncbi:MAG TPA: hypothetical protein VF008_08255, partial [Niastella sp.]
MIKTIPSTVILFIFNSCASYQYSTVSSAGVAQNDKREFVIENDSLRLVYNFNGYNAPVNITIQNKLPVPVYIDWQRSALIVNDKAISYVPAEMRIDGAFHGSNYNLGNNGSSYGSNSGHIHATASLPPSVDFMPPQTYLTKNPLNITSTFIENVPETALHREKYMTVEGITVPVKRATFAETTSPLRFRSFLTLMVGEPNTKPFNLEHSFYVSELMTTTTPPLDMHLNSTSKGNTFFTKKTNGAAGAVVVGTLVFGT